MTLSFHSTRLLFWGLTAEESLFGPFLLLCSPQRWHVCILGKKNALYVLPCLLSFTAIRKMERSPTATLCFLLKELILLYENSAQDLGCCQEMYTIFWSALPSVKGRKMLWQLLSYVNRSGNCKGFLKHFLEIRHQRLEGEEMNWGCKRP